MYKAVVPAELIGISEGLDFIEDTLKKYKFRSKSIRESMLLSEESMVRLIKNAPAGSTIHISLKRRGQLAHITLSAPGAELDPAEGVTYDLGESDLSRDSEAAIRGVLLRAYEDKIRYARKGKYNFINVTAGSIERVYASRTLIALAASIITGYALQLILSDAAKDILNVYILAPIENIFINLLLLVTAPAIFLSIVTSTSKNSSFLDPGRVSVKAFISYLLTSITAVIVGYAVFNTFLPGSEGLLSGLISSDVQASSAASTDVISTLVSIVPSNIVEPFYNTKTLQLIFVALLGGIALGRIGGYSSTLQNMAEALNTLFTKIIGIIMNFIPLAIFASTVYIIINAGSRIMLYVGYMLLTMLAVSVLMLLIYCLALLIFARLNPVTFLRKYAPCMKETLIIGSALSALPKNIRCCKNSLGISPKVYSFTLPFGASFNMDGNCAYLTVAGLFIARLCGVDIFSHDLLPLIFSVLVLSVGAPIVPGTTLICLIVLLTQMGIPLVAASIIFGVNAAVEMFLAMTNSVGDVALTLIIAKTEGLLDKDAFNALPKKKQVNKA